MLPKNLMCQHDSAFRSTVHNRTGLEGTQVKRTRRVGYIILSLDISDSQQSTMASSDEEQDGYEMIAGPTGVDTFSFGRNSPFSETSDGSWTNVDPSTQRSQQSSLVLVSGVRSIDHRQQAQQEHSDDEESVDTQECEKIKEDMISMFDTATIECPNPPDTLLWDPSVISTSTDQVADVSNQEANPEYLLANPECLLAVYDRATPLPSPKGLCIDRFAAEQPRVAATRQTKKVSPTWDEHIDQLKNGLRDFYLRQQDTGEESQEKSAPEIVLQQPAVDNTENSLPRETAKYIYQDLPAPPSSNKASDDGPISRVWGSPSGSALCSVFDPPHHLIHKGRGFEGALLHARESNRLLLVNLQQYPGFGCYAINRDIWRDELTQDLIEARFVFWQSTTDTRDAIAYAQHFRVSLFPHVAVINPNHRSHIWGIEGWSAENPWTASDMGQKLSEITFDRFTVEQLSMEEVDEEEPFIAEPMVDVSSEIELQASILCDHDYWSAENISEFYELQQVVLLSTTTEDHHMDTGL
jgi:hypothetical protein